METQHGQCPVAGCGKHGFVVEPDGNGEYFVHFKLRHNGQTHAQKVSVTFFQQFVNATPTQQAAKISQSITDGSKEESCKFA